MTGTCVHCSTDFLLDKNWLSGDDVTFGKDSRSLKWFITDPLDPKLVEQIYRDYLITNSESDANILEIKQYLERYGLEALCSFDWMSSQSLHPHSFPTVTSC